MRASFRIGAGVFMILLSSWSTAKAAVRAEDNEVVFSLHARGAGRVFLVGDFNNWNPTLEKMDQEGDLFVIRLYLLAGTYRYKFVVDGESINDPDNPPTDPKRGSLLVLESRAGMIVIGSDEPAEERQKESKLEPHVRYAGVFLLDDKATNSDQALDFYFGYEGKGIRAHADFQTANDTWSLSPLEADVFFNRGFAEVALGEARLRAFESDTIYASSDPYGLVGDIGVHHYNAGYVRKGLSFESPKIAKTRLRAFYADYTGERLQTPMTLPPSAFGGFPTSTTPDTLVYGFAPTFNDEDTWAWEAAADFGSFGIGYGSRLNRGLHPGLITEVTRVSGGYDIATYETRERWDADAVWLSWEATARVTLAGGFGWSSAEIQQTLRSVTTDTAIGEIGIGEDATSFDGRLDLQSSRRWNGTLSYDHGHLDASIEYQGSKFEFDPVSSPASTAEIASVLLAVAYAKGPWRTGIDARIVDQDYGETPAEFHYFTPSRNFWLDWGDGLDVRGQVEFDMERATDVSFYVGWRDAKFDLDRPLRPVVPLALRGTVSAVASDIAGRIEYAAARIDAEVGFRSRWYVDLHTRFAHYDKTSWQIQEDYIAGFVGGGYRTKRMRLSVGFGPDPVVLDPVPNTYRNNGWEEALRSGIPADLRRDGSQVLGDGLQAAERFLEDRSVFQLEMILFF
jgi:hypothetical protein